MESQQIRAVLMNELKPALGCTEPAAVALAVATARQYVPGALERIDVSVDPNVFKNGAGVFVPGSNDTGLAVAAALGATAGRAELGLEVLRDVTPSSLAEARRLLDEQQVGITIHTGGEPGLHIAATVRASGHTSTAVISGSHTHLASVTLDGEIVITNGPEQAATQPVASGADLKDMGLMTLIETIIASDDAEWSFLIPLAETNMEVARYGLGHQEGLGIGAHLRALIGTGMVADDLANACLISTAAAADTRMQGVSLPVISTNGSGNQGLAISVPITVAAGRLPGGREHLGKALAIGQCGAIYLKQYIGKLSALCACAVASATGTALAVAYLLGCDTAQTEAAGKLVAANLTGMICDGAKVGCALKLASSSAASIQAALLAAGGVVISADNGVVGETLEETIRNIGRVSNPGMVETDSVLLSIVEGKVYGHQ